MYCVMEMIVYAATGAVDVFTIVAIVIVVAINFPFFVVFCIMFLVFLLKINALPFGRF